MQSEVLSNFYKAYLSWVVAGANEQNEWRFDPHCGLCSNLGNFCYSKGQSITPNEEVAAQYEMSQQFRDAEMDSLYPFHRKKGGNLFRASEQFRQDCDAAIHHRKETRMQWVRDHAK